MNQNSLITLIRDGEGDWLCTTTYRAPSSSLMLGTFLTGKESCSGIGRWYHFLRMDGRHVIVQSGQHHHRIVKSLGEVTSQHLWDSSSFSKTVDLQLRISWTALLKTPVVVSCDFNLRHSEKKRWISSHGDFLTSLVVLVSSMPSTPLLWFWQHNTLNEIPEPPSSVPHLSLIPPTATHTSAGGGLDIVPEQRGVKH